MKPLVLFLVIIAVFISVNASAQTTAYEEGFVVLKNSDTVYGQVKDRSEEPFGKLYKKVKVKIEGKLFTQKYASSDIKSYQKGSTYFESVWFKEDSKFFNISYRSISGVGEEVFMKVILTGTLTYYHWEWRNPDSGYYLYTPFFKKKGSNQLICVTQDLLELRRKDVANYLAEDPNLTKPILSDEKLSALEITKLYNQAADKN